MRITPISLKKQNALIDDYRKQDPQIMEHFTYNPFLQTTYHSRAKFLQQQSVDRNHLANVLVTMNEKWDAPAASFRNIERLRDNNSVTVIGGQQAGLLTGPMYTINKIISIIQFSRKQESELNQPVIPVFWIAGEDHDFAEINHVYTPEREYLNKIQIRQQVNEKTPVSETEIDQTAAREWIDELFVNLDETRHTHELYSKITECLENATTYVDFFARILYQIFTDEGLVLVDSGDYDLRAIEQKQFTELINKQNNISTSVYTAINELNQKGYSISLDTTPDDGHLFYHNQSERLLLKRDANGYWIDKHSQISLTTEEMLDTASNHPEHLSNNVVTRPLMQEWLFPTLAFMGGPGEIGYWASLKPAFEAVGLEMPPVLPRLSLTFVDRYVEKVMNQHSILAENAVNYGIETDKIQWLSSKNNPSVEEVASEVRQAVRNVHKPLRDIAKETRSDIGELADRNIYYLDEHINYLEKRITNAIKENHAQQLKQFDIIQQFIHPFNGLQERIWNPLWWINEYGPCFIQNLSYEMCSFEYDHYLVYL